MDKNKESKNYIKAHVDYVQGMKYKDIASKYNVSLNTVKSWKRRYKWTRTRTRNHAINELLGA